MTPKALAPKVGKMQPRRENRERDTEGKREKGGEKTEACILNTVFLYTPFMLGSIFLVPDCMGMTFATLAAAERLVVLGEPVGALFVGSYYTHTYRNLLGL